MGCFIRICQRLDQEMPLPLAEPKLWTLVFFIFFLKLSRQAQTDQATEGGVCPPLNVWKRLKY